jgi:uncharacterized protein (TIRG00374 family)
MKRNAAISLVVGVIISALTLYLAFKNVPFSDLTSYVVSIDYLWILPTVVVVLLSFVLRAYRWQVILKSTGEVSFWNAYHPLMIGFMINSVLPGRVGEIARPVILKKQEDIPFSTGLATVAAERVFDVIIMIVLFAALLATVQIDPNLDITFGKYHLNRAALLTAGRGLFNLLLLLLAGIIIISFDGAEFKEKAQKKVCTPLVKLVENFSYGFALIKYPAKIVICLGLSFVIWILSALAYYLMAQGCPGIGLSFAELFAVMIIICFFIALPSVPGYWGIWEAGGIFGLTLFGVATKEAAGFTLVNHVIQMFPIIIAGIISAMITSINIIQVSYQTNRNKAS